MSACHNMKQDLEQGCCEQLTARGTPAAYIYKGNDHGGKSLAMLVTDVGLVSPQDGSMLGPLSGASGETWMTYSRIQPRVLTWLLQGGKLFEQFWDDKEACRKKQTLADESTKPLFRLLGYSAYQNLKHRHAKDDEYALRLQEVFSATTDDANTSNTVRNFATVHLQARQDLIHTLLAPDRVRLWLHTFRVLNSRIWEAIGDALQNDESIRNAQLPGEHNMWKLRDRLVTMFKDDQDTLFSAVEVHVLTVQEVEEKRKVGTRDWHTDAFTSLLHMAITLQGSRTLGLLVQDEDLTPEDRILCEMQLHEMRQHPGDIYIGTPAVYRHAVYSHEAATDNLSLQCRLGFPKWDPDVWSPWGEHGFHPWKADDNSLAVRILSGVIAEAFRQASDMFGGVRIPEWYQLAEQAHEVSLQERTWFERHGRPRAWQRPDAPLEEPRDY